jgi:hypothetical protein
LPLRRHFAIFATAAISFAISPLMPLIISFHAIDCHCRHSDIFATLAPPRSMPPPPLPRRRR